MSVVSQHPIEQLSATGPWDGPSYRYRGATFGVPGTITSIVDLWLDERRLPQHIRQKPRL